MTMDNPTKQEIIDAIRRTAKENDGKPLGSSRFTNETGINPYYWKKYWARFGDAQKEAGFTPNILNPAYPDEFLFKKIIGLMHKSGKFPTTGELRIEKNNDSNFPNYKSFFETKEQKRKFANKLLEWCKNKSGYEDITKLCTALLEESVEKSGLSDTNLAKEIGEVYLFKSGRYYKIGRTNDTVRRGNEIRIQLPERTDLIHSIKTDDPSGIEAYWHKRFEQKRMNGEWFNLTQSDIKAFKRWKKIF